MARTRTRSRPFTLSFGALMSTTMSICLRNFLAFALLGILVLSPWIAYMLLLPTIAEHVSMRSFQLIAVIGGLLPSLFGLVLTGAVTYGVVQQMRGKPAGMASCISVGLRSFLGILGTGILAGLRIFLFFLLLIVPGIIEACRLWLAVPAAVMERTSPTKSIDRSIRLTDGSRWTIFGAVLFVVLVTQVTQVVLDRSGLADSNIHLYIGLVIVITISSQIAIATASAVCYFMLRQGKENVAVEELAAVFA